jgi:predicted RND superfamily exporter protein
MNAAYSRLGTDVMQGYIEGSKDTMLDPKVYQKIEALDRYMYETVPEVRSAQSLVPIIKLVNSVLYEGDPSYELLPDTTQEIGFDIYMFRSRGEPGDFSAYTDPEWRFGNVSFFLEDHSGPTIERATDAAHRFLETVGNDGQTPGDTGDADTTKSAFLFTGGQIGIIEALNTEIRKANNRILVAIALVIGLCVVIYYHSIAAGLILLLSLATANYLTYTFMAVKGIGLNVSTLPLAALGIGLGVDYGVYMLDRIREEYRKCGDDGEAVKRAFLTAGNAIFVTAMTMILPLLPWAIFSSLRFQAQMGMLLALVLFLNMLGALLFLPAASLFFRPKSLFGSADVDEEKAIPEAT